MTEDSVRPAALQQGSEESSLPTPRSCGTCFACCIWSGVEAAKTPDRTGLRTYAGESCVYLDPTDPRKCCSVYNRRPNACQRFQCAWLQGLGGNLDRPDQSGVMVSIYADDEIDPLKPANATITVIDGEKCGELDNTSGPLRRWIDYLTTLVNLRDIRVVNYRTQTVLHLVNGFIYMGKLHKQTSPEDLSFDHGANNGLPIGRFEVRDIEKEQVQ